MEDVIVYLIVIVAIVVNFVRNYKKEQEKNKARTLTQQPASAQPPTDTALPTPAPFSRRKSVEPLVQEENTNSSNAKPVIDYPSLENNYRNNYQPLEIESDEFETEIRSEESIAFDINKKDVSINLELNTPYDLKKAFIHSLIFDRKY